jgi:dipeptidyl aminopeptidase/acylaminoacyl peptidase
VYSINPENGEQAQITFENRHLLDQLQMGKVEPRWVPTTDGKEMLVWVIYPANFDPAKNIQPSSIAKADHKAL